MQFPGRGAYVSFAVPDRAAVVQLEGAMARAGLEGDSRRLHRARELARHMVDAAAGGEAR